ncbi:uncharacterized protein I303_108388 [Kwoniella dejecticola CBS 10117]|uniref:Restriction endonuclease type IV Mrr domain-containing protein n=1 Tax=Kwoniella dejecticola CBS 10117 TaxID=1296121 RepID=A0A1A5ZXJ2_9TREE|nr:uncharacterized protein I303_07285 [Kwoniella dejecticola CBS 10117]OBR82525.1 hypothetical protein I303_07285 [Kwoniella dejecticola CBS 10117]
MTLLPKTKATRRTTLEIGTAFEKHALRYLNDGLCMDLRRVGGAHDGGIDLRGWWWLPRSRARASTTGTDQSGQSVSSPSEVDTEGTRRIRVIAQCKAEKKRLGPRAIRELEGVMANLRSRTKSISPPPPVLSSSALDQTSPTADHDHDHVHDIGILVSQSGFTKSTMTYSTTSNIPLMLIHLPGGQPNDDEQLTSSDSETDSESESEAASASASAPDLGKEGRGSDVDDIEVSSLWWNNALSDGVLGDDIQLRRTIGPKGVGVGLWMDGRRVKRCGPAST